jgi:hypothetical protein
VVVGQELIEELSCVVCYMAIPLRSNSLALSALHLVQPPTNFLALAVNLSSTCWLVPRASLPLGCDTFALPCMQTYYSSSLLTPRCLPSSTNILGCTDFSNALRRHARDFAWIHITLPQSHFGAAGPRLTSMLVPPSLSPSLSIPSPLAKQLPQKHPASSGS